MFAGFAHLTQSANAQSSGPGAPTTKKQCKADLKKQRKFLTSYKAKFAKSDKKAKAKLASLKASADKHAADAKALQEQGNALVETQTDDMTQEQLDALNAQIDSIRAQENEASEQANEAEEKYNDAKYAQEQAAKQYKIDVKNLTATLNYTTKLCKKLK